METYPPNPLPREGRGDRNAPRSLAGKGAGGIGPALGFGIGLRPEHYPELLADPRRAEWYEAISENYMDTHGRPLAVLEHVRRERPVALHGVGLSIGSTDPLDLDYLRRLRDLVRRIQPALVTDHCCWTGVAGRPLYDLLPLPYTEETLSHVAMRVAAVQDYLGCRIALENPSAYIAFCASTMSEAEFLTALAQAADCLLLLDVNNVFVSASNLGFDAGEYLEELPPDRIAQIHLAGFADMGTYLFDTHSAPVHAAVWELYRSAVRRFGVLPTLIEWDAEIPSLDRLCAEAALARSIAEGSNDYDAADAARAARASGVADPEISAAAV
jgi:uncharacterized protein (UPF0276 family)